MTKSTNNIKPKKPHILVVDDETSVCEFLCEFLTDEGFSAENVQDGIEALAAFKRRPADLVITDVFMPRMDGLELVDSLRELYQGIRCIAISGGGIDRDLSQLTDAGRLGAQATITKPFNLEDILKAINATLALSEETVLHGAIIKSQHLPSPFEKYTVQWRQHYISNTITLKSPSGEVKNTGYSANSDDDSALIIKQVMLDLNPTQP